MLRMRRNDCSNLAESIALGRAATTQSKDNALILYIFIIVSAVLSAGHKVQLA